MKKNSTKRVLAIVGCVIAIFLGIVIWQFYTEKQYVDYQIESVAIEEIQLDDSTLANYRHYLLTFHVVPFHYRHGLFISGTPPYPNGCADSIVDFYLESATHERMNQNVMPLNMDKGHSAEALTLYTSSQGIPDSIEVDHYSDMTHLKEVLQRGWDDPYGNHRAKVWRQRAFMISLAKDSIQLQSIIIKFKEKEIRGAVTRNQPIIFSIHNVIYPDPINTP
ncbi:MAG: hypothetical protein IJP75_04630 [Bacteroidaceae bacterium]|nr:hypothetical protein [Bacteroidaceae bacterium]